MKTQRPLRREPPPGAGLRALGSSLCSITHLLVLVLWASFPSRLLPGSLAAWVPASDLIPLPQKPRATGQGCFPAPLPARPWGTLTQGPSQVPADFREGAMQAQGQSSRDKITEKKRQIEDTEDQRGGGGRPWQARGGGGMDQPKPEITDDSHLNSVGGRPAEQAGEANSAQSPHQDHGLRSQVGPFPWEQATPRSQDSHSEAEGSRGCLS